jgi:3-deoxy-D-manno-octulosonic-acid transferase
VLHPFAFSWTVLLINLILPLYNLVWRAAMPFLRRSLRMSIGWEQRTLHDPPNGPFDIWIQSASGGEALLTNMVLVNLAGILPRQKRLRVLATSGTKQGIDSLRKGRDMLPVDNNLEIEVAYFPFDAPPLMHKAFARFTPKLAVIVETELWPGFLIFARRNNVPVFLINGRISEKSFSSYRRFRSFFRQYGPERIWAISPLDRQRFARIFGTERVDLMNNIKFDRIEPKTAFPNSPIAALLPKTAPFVLLGSIRREEEQVILKTVIALLARRNNIVIGLFPKHIERADHWLALLHGARIEAVKRSQISEKRQPGNVIVGDVFGELAGAYALAAAAFVGGSLVNLGGQNFLEPLAFGLKPIIGPYWKDFAWVGRDIVTSGLVREVANGDELTAALLAAIDDRQEREDVILQVHRFFAPRKGGTEQISQQIIDKLRFLEKN